MDRPGQASLAGGVGFGRPQQFRRYLAAKLGVIEQNLRHILAKTFLLVGFRLKSVLRYWSELAILREDSLQ